MGNSESLPVVRRSTFNKSQEETAEAKEQNKVLNEKNKHLEKSISELSQANIPGMEMKGGGKKKKKSKKRKKSIKRKKSKKKTKYIKKTRSKKNKTRTKKR